MVRIKRAYELPAPEDGRRYLVDRLWPRGITRDALRIDDWLKELAPSDGLRKWFNHEPAKWDEFRAKYTQELQVQRDLLARLRAEAKKGDVTLVFAAKDAEHNNAVVLGELIEP